MEAVVVDSEQGPEQTVTAIGTPEQPRRRGRPPIPEEKARSQRVVTFVTRHDMEALKALADGAGNTLSATVYALLRQGLENKQGESP